MLRMWGKDRHAESIRLLPRVPIHAVRRHTLNCPCCSRPRPLNFVPDGIWYRPYTEIPTDIAYRCECGTNRSIPWAEATLSQRIEAGLVQASREYQSEMMGR